MAEGRKQQHNAGSQHQHLSRTASSPADFPMSATATAAPPQPAGSPAPPEAATAARVELFAVMDRLMPTVGGPEALLDLCLGWGTERVPRWLQALPRLLDDLHAHRSRTRAAPPLPADIWGHIFTFTPDP